MLSRLYRDDIFLNNHRFDHRAGKHLIPDIIGSAEETTTGIIRLQAMEEEGSLKFP